MGEASRSSGGRLAIGTRLAWVGWTVQVQRVGQFVWKIDAIGVKVFFVGKKLVQFELVVSTIHADFSLKLQKSVNGTTPLAVQELTFVALPVPPNFDHFSFQQIHTDSARAIMSPSPEALKMITWR